LYELENALGASVRCGEEQNGLDHGNDVGELIVQVTLHKRLLEHKTAHGVGHRNDWYLAKSFKGTLSVAQSRLPIPIAPRSRSSTVRQEKVSELRPMVAEEKAPSITYHREH
jgi:hypothetical protein